MLSTTLSIVGGQGGVAGHAFISYVHEDSGEVDRLQQTLEGAGIRVWRDTGSLWPGEDWRQRIRHAITDGALVFIACFSTKSLARETTYQNEELVLAIEQLRMRPPNVSWLIPVRLDECKIPDHDIGAGRTLNSIQHLDLFGDQHGEAASRLVAAVLRILAQHSSVSLATQQAAQDTDQRQRQEPSVTPAMTSPSPDNPRTTAQNVGSSREGDREHAEFPRRDPAADERADETSADANSGQPTRKRRKRRTVIALIVLAAAVLVVYVALFAGHQPQSVSPTAILSLPDWVATVVFSPNGRILAAGTGDTDHSVTLWDVENPAQPIKIANFTRDTGTVRTVAFSANSQILATASWDHTVTLWNIKNPAQPRYLAIITRHTDEVEALAFSPDGWTLATGGWDKGKPVYLWNVVDPAHPTLIRHSYRPHR